MLRVFRRHPFHEITRNKLVTGSLASLKSFMVALLHTVRTTDSHKSGFLKYNGDDGIAEPSYNTDFQK